WEWNGTAWTPAAIGPPPRTMHAMAYDSVRGVTVMFGGYSPPLENTYEWNGTDWVLRFPPSSPTWRYRHAMAFDAARGVTVMFGGVTSTNDTNQTWEWNGATWRLRSNFTGPSARSDAAMAYDSDRAVTVMFGGTRTVGGPGPYRNGETWEWSGTVWTQ